MSCLLGEKENSRKALYDLVSDWTGMSNEALGTGQSASYFHFILFLLTNRIFVANQASDFLVAL